MSWWFPFGGSNERKRREEEKAEAERILAEEQELNELRKAKALREKMLLKDSDELPDYSSKN